MVKRFTLMLFALSLSCVGSDFTVPLGVYGISNPVSLVGPGKVSLLVCSVTQPSSLTIASIVVEADGKPITLTMSALATLNDRYQLRQDIPFQKSLTVTTYTMGYGGGSLTCSLM